ncbi:hypothetical protein ACROYT_G030984 [Oculina patagonica]
MLAVDIINVSSGECISTVKTMVRHENIYEIMVISCNSQNQLLVFYIEEIENYFGEQELTVSLRNNNVLKRVWQRSTKRYGEDLFFTPGFIFSPEEDFVVTWNTFDSGYGIHILDAKTGETCNTLLQEHNGITDCKFVANCETLVCCSRDNFLRLVSVRSGELLSVLDIEDRPYCVGACLGKSLVAIGLSRARLKFIHVELPRVKDAEEKKGEISQAAQVDIFITVLENDGNVCTKVYDCCEHLSTTLKMAAAAASPLASSVEKTNGAKLSRLLIDGGTMVLRNVFDRRILNKSQWDKLFPSSGATPDSKTFDITLLFLLLTNICGLTPPPSGWHSKPPPSDTSLEANLARIKFFRNELYGHVTSTGVDTPTFNALWQEISVVLVALGLNQGEIDRLKVERCGEDDYLDTLRDWADSDEDIKSQLKDIRQGQTETQQQVEKVLQIQLEDHKTLQDSISRLECVSQTQTTTRQAVEEVHETLQAGLQDVKQEFENLKRKREMDRADDLLKTLAMSEFKGDIEYHAQRFQEGTREWIFKKVDDWLDDKTSQNRVMVITGDAGIGKSVVSAVVCKRMQEAGRLSGSHFCQHNNVRYRNPQLMLQSLASHLSRALPEYKEALLEQLSRNLGTDEMNNMGVEELFALLFKEPLSTVSDPGRNILMVIDALDESEYKGRNELLDVIANHFCKLPLWIRFLMTTRPEVNIANSLKSLQPLQLESNGDDNKRDIRLFFEKGLSQKEFRQELELDEDKFLSFLSAVTAAQEPLPLGFISNMFSFRAISSHRKVNKAISCISTLLPVRDGRLHIFHKSVKDWLTDASCYGQHEFIVDQKEGCQVLSQLCETEFDVMKRNGIHGTQFSDTEKYALNHGVRHMLEMMTGQHEYFEVLPTTVQCGVTTALSVMRKHKHVLRRQPQHFFQAILNEGGHEYASKASQILQNRYPEIPYIEVLREVDNSEEGKVQARFECDSLVACFDVSPQMEYMVCECIDRSIQLWSLQSGDRLWSREALTVKPYGSLALKKPCALRDTANFCNDEENPDGNSSLSFYRSVVFHPDGKSVLPGSLKEVFTITGDLIPLIPASNCRFTVCAFSRDKTKMLTDCPDNPKHAVMWNMSDGAEIARIRRKKNVSSFAFSSSGEIVAVSDCSQHTGFFKVENLNCESLCEIATPWWICGLMNCNSNGIVFGYIKVDVWHHGKIHFIYSDLSKLRSLPSYPDGNDKNTSQWPWELKSLKEVRLSTVIIVMLMPHASSCQ